MLPFVHSKYLTILRRRSEHTVQEKQEKEAQNKRECRRMFDRRGSVNVSHWQPRTCRRPLYHLTNESFVSRRVCMSNKRALCNPSIIRTKPTFLPDLPIEEVLARPDEGLMRSDSCTRASSDLIRVPQGDGS